MTRSVLAGGPRYRGGLGQPRVLGRVAHLRVSDQIAESGAVIEGVDHGCMAVGGLALADDCTDLA